MERDANDNPQVPVAVFRGHTEFSFVTFDDTIVQSVPLQPGLHSLDKLTDSLSLSKTKESKTGLYGGLTEAVRTLGTPQPGDALLLITAWEDAGKSDAQATALDSLSANVRLFGVSFDSSRLPGKIPAGTVVTETGYAPIDAVAKSSGGFWIRVSGDGSASNSIPRAFSLSFMADFYAVDLKLAQPLAKAEQLKIELTKGDGIRLKPNFDIRDVIFSYPRALYPCR